MYNDNINPAAASMVQGLVADGYTKFFELGCWTGALGEFLIKKYPITWSGLEYSEKAIALARRRFPVIQHNLNDGIEAIRGIIHTTDVLVMVDVLEHLHNPILFLRTLQCSMRSDQRLIVVLPNIECHQVIEKLVEGAFEYEPTGILDETHRYFWTPSSFVKDCTRLGFSVAKGPIFLNNKQGEDIMKKASGTGGTMNLSGKHFSLTLHTSEERLRSIASYGFGFVLRLSEC